MALILPLTYPLFPMPAQKYYYVLVSIEGPTQVMITRFQINGNKYTYNLGDLPQKIIDGWEYMSGFIEIPVNTDHLKHNNKITLDPLNGFRMLYSSLVMKNLSTALNHSLI